MILGQKKGTPIKDRFLSHVKKGKSCWLWTASQRSGYGVFAVNHGNNKKAHRVSYLLFVGKIPAGKFVCHKCDNPLCVNPAHLWLGSHLENMRDMYSKKRNIPKKGEANGRSKLTERQVKMIRNSPERLLPLSRRFGVSMTVISQIKRKKLWPHVN